MAVITALPTLTCSQFAPHLETEYLHISTGIDTVADEKKPGMAAEAREAVEDAPATSSPTCGEDEACAMPRHSSEAEIEARLARIRGHEDHTTASCTVDPERLARLRKAQCEAMEKLKTSVVFRPSSDMAEAVAAIERRKMWEGLRGWE